MSGIELRTDAVIGHIDELSEIGSSVSIADTVSRGNFVTIRGWLLDRQTQRPPDAISLSFGTGSSVEAVHGLPRPDIGAAFGEDAIRSGFAAAVPVDAPLGRCTLSIHPRRDGRTSPVALREALTVLPAQDPFAGRQRRPGSWAFFLDGVFAQGKRADCDATGAYIVDPSEPAQIMLWAIDTASMQPPQELIVRYGGRYLAVASTIDREDAAASVQAPGAARCGFALPLVPSPIGTENIDIYALDHDDSFAHLISLRARQPHPLPAHVLPESAQLQGAVDFIVVASTRVPNDGIFGAYPGAPIGVRGWVVDTVGPRLSGGVQAVIDGVAIAETQTLLMRPDVAGLFGTSGLMESGFDLNLSVPLLAPGVHELAVRAFSARRDSTAVFGRRLFRVPRRKGRRG